MSPLDGSDRKLQTIGATPQTDGAVEKRTGGCAGDRTCLTGSSLHMAAMAVPNMFVLCSEIVGGLAKVVLSCM